MLLDLAGSIDLKEGKDYTTWIHKRTIRDYFVRKDAV
jgi:hypothetical protein